MAVFAGADLNDTIVLKNSEEASSSENIIDDAVGDYGVTL